MLSFKPAEQCWRTWRWIARGKSNGVGRQSRKDFHNVDEQNNDSYIYDSISIMSKVHFMTNVFNNVQWNVLLDGITSEVQAKYKHILTYLCIANKAGNHCTARCKLDTGCTVNLIPYCEFNYVFPTVSISDLAKMIDKNVTLEAYHKSEIKQLSMCRLTLMNGHHSRLCSFFILPDRCKPIIGLADCASLGIISKNCPVTTS